MHPFMETQKEYLREGLPQFRPGDTLRVNVRVREGDKERIQAFEGVCIARKHGGVNETFKVRKISGGVGVERTFPLHSPMLATIEVVRQGRVRRAKLYYLRNLRGKAARIKERRTARPGAKSATGFARNDRGTEIKRSPCLCLFVCGSVVRGPGGRYCAVVLGDNCHEP